MSPNRRRGRAGPRRRGPTSDQQLRMVGYNRLKEWADLSEDPDYLLVLIMINLDGLKLLLNSQTLNKDKLQLLSVILETTYRARNHTQSFTVLLQTLVVTQFFTRDMSSYLSSHSSTLSTKLACTTVLYLQEASSRIPSEIDECSSTVMFIYENHTRFDCDFDLVMKMRVSFQSRDPERPPTQTHSMRNTQLEQPPQNFREIPIIPTGTELSSNFKPVLYEIKTEGAFKDKFEYLEILFRLLREDFVQPLRNAVNSGSDVTIYKNVRIIGLEVDDGIKHVLQLDLSQLKKLNKASDGSFLSGNLVCVSYDDFRSILFATLAHNHAKEISNGKLRVSFIGNLANILNISMETSLKMIESPSFFVPYSQVLEGLQDWSDLPLPFESQIVLCKNIAYYPGYISPTTIYDISCLVHEENSQRSIGCRVLNTGAWPTLRNAPLNSEQLEAVKVALTHQLTLIQGPPGTGKTYVSLKIMRALIENMDVQNPSNGPILVVCYTNHALDQFLEGILKFCTDGVIRVGGSSKCVALEPYNLSEIRQNDKQRNRFFGKALYEIYSELKPIEKKIKHISDRIMFANRTVLDENVLCEFMHDCHFNSLRGRVTKNKSDSVMKVWLSVNDADVDSHVRRPAEAHLLTILMNDRSMRNDTCLNFSQNIPVTTKATVYRRWVDKYENRFGRTREGSILSDEQLKPFVSKNVMASIYSSGYSSIRSWILGEDTEEIVANIEFLCQVNTPSASVEVRGMEDSESHSSSSDLGWDEDAYEDYSDDSDSCYDESDDESSLVRRLELLGVDLSFAAGPQRPVSRSDVLRQIETCAVITTSEETSITDVWRTGVTDRFRLYKTWRARYLESLNERMTQLNRQYEILLERKREIQRMRDISILRRAKVVGMTTTGAAKNRKVLAGVGPRIVVVEEAAEVLEAHIITALSQHCQHLILIGDHQQLRPKTEVYELAQHYNLDLSLFERLVNNKFRCVQLKEQFRMRPEISIFMRHIYPDLKDGLSVRNRPMIDGMDKSVFFIKHKKAEMKVKGGTSKLNTFEANYLLKLAEYLISQGHSASDITILGAYGGQVQLIQDLKVSSKKSCLNDVRVSTIDNFQGEENKVILLSLVRSNAENSVGFLRTDNRICVALSRAKFGMYVVGDMDLLSKHSKLLRNIKCTAEEQDCIGPVLNLSCHQHHNLTEIREVGDFDRAIQLKGCGRPCKAELDCGHICSQICHLGDHENYICKEKCLIVCPRGHRCTAKCNESCPPCLMMVDFTLSCGHVQTQRCSVNILTLQCREKCARKCRYGHPCEYDCKVKCPPCDVLVQRQLPCGHTLTAPCRNRNNDCVEKCEKSCPRGHPCPLLCREKCSPCKLLDSVSLSCGHILREQCWKFTAGTAMCAQTCTKICSRGHHCPKLCHEWCKQCYTPLPCGHSCLAPLLLSETPLDPLLADAPCVSACLVYCGNGHNCPNKCGDVCPDRCPVVLRCGHSCKQTFQPGNLSVRGLKPICNEPCEKVCDRGHQCFSNCSEPCLPCGETLDCGHRCDSVPVRLGPPWETPLCEKRCSDVMSDRSQAEEGDVMSDRGQGDEGGGMSYRGHADGDVMSDRDHADEGDIMSE
ncbi:hypothetical protein Btru_011807 [Bulinus truncatus]|nr:hypothetical protein Btru_011807 [Bulinus truncatus]